MKKVTKFPVRGYTFIKTEDVGKIIGLQKKNRVVAISPKDDIEWEAGDCVELGEGAKGFGVKYGDEEVICMPNIYIILVEKK